MDIVGREKEQSLVVSLRGERAPIRRIALVTAMSKGVVERWGKNIIKAVLK